MATVESLVTPLTSDQSLEVMLSSLETIGVKARSWRKGGSLRTILRVVATLYAAWTVVLVAFVKSAFLETAFGGWLDLLGANVYGVTRRPAAFAEGSLTITNSGASIYSFVAGELRFLNSTTGKAYTNTLAFDLNPGDVVTTTIRAVEIGTASSASTGDVDELETFLLGVTCTNAAPIIGVDEESDEDYRAHCKERIAALSPNGPRDAYAYAIREAKLPTGSPTTINRWGISRSSSTGTVTIRLATASGVPSVAEVDAVKESVERYARPDTVTASVAAGTGVTVTRTITVWARRVDGVDAAGIKALVDAEILALSSTYPVGGIPKPPSSAGYFWSDRLKIAAGRAHESIFEVDGEGADVALTSSQFPVLAITVDVRIVDVA